MRRDTLFFVSIKKKEESYCKTFYFFLKRKKMASSSSSEEIKWFKVTPAYAYIKDVEDREVEYRSTTRKKQRLLCDHCYREVTFLIFHNACTYECALAIASRYVQMFDFIFSRIQRECDNYRGIVMPSVAPRLQDDTISPEEYWENISQELYGNDEIMLSFLEERLQENATKPSSRGHGAVIRRRTK
jgi:hypothetical protein